MRSITPHGSGHRNPQLQHSADTPLVRYPSFCGDFPGHTYQWELRFVVNRIPDQAPLVEPDSQRNAFLFRVSSFWFRRSLQNQVQCCTATSVHPGIANSTTREEPFGADLFNLSRGGATSGLILKAEVVPKWHRGTGSRTIMKQ